jgi:hypothetical protein
MKTTRIKLIAYCSLEFLELTSKQQERRYKAKFARRIADTIILRASLRQLTPEALANEFR